MGLGLGCLLSARIEAISVSSSTSSGSGDVGTRDVILDIGWGAGEVRAVILILMLS